MSIKVNFWCFYCLVRKTLKTKNFVFKIFVLLLNGKLLIGPDHDVLYPSVFVVSCLFRSHYFKFQLFGLLVWFLDIKKGVNILRAQKPNPNFTGVWVHILQLNGSSG